MKNKIFCALFLLITVFAVSCKKEPGIGGDASIQGKILVRHYNSIFGVPPGLINEYNGADIYVYIIYGNNISYGQRIKSSYDGRFEFKYLYEGDYKIYIYSIDSAAVVHNPSVIHPDSAAIVKVSITDRKQEEDIGTLTIFQ